MDKISIEITQADIDLAIENIKYMFKCAFNVIGLLVMYYAAVFAIVWAVVKIFTNC